MDRRRGQTVIWDERRRVQAFLDAGCEVEAFADPAPKSGAPPDAARGGASRRGRAPTWPGS